MMKFWPIFALFFILVGCQDKLAPLAPTEPVPETVQEPEQRGGVPVITLQGPNPVVLNQGEAYVEPGVQALDFSGNDITTSVIRTNNINSQTVGVYSVYYNVTDVMGQRAQEVIRTVQVKAPLNTSNGTIRTYAYPNQGTSPYEYHEYLPKGYDQNPGMTYPLIIFLHGAGERGGVDASGKRTGAALSSVLIHGPLKRVKAGVHFPAVIVEPQSPVWWNSGTLKRFLDVMKTKYRVNPKKIYVTGLSMGGGGTWDFARAYPNEVAAIVPICGASSISSLDAAKPLLNIPVWAFHARGDGTVPLSNSYSFLNLIFQNITGKTDKIATYYTSTTTTNKTAALESRLDWIIYEGVNPGVSKDKLLTIYPHNSHDSWTETYNNQKMWDWLFSKSR